MNFEFDSFLQIMKFFQKMSKKKYFNFFLRGKGRGFLSTAQNVAWVCLSCTFAHVKHYIKKCIKLAVLKVMSGEGFIFWSKPKISRQCDINGVSFGIWFIVGPCQGGKGWNKTLVNYSSCFWKKETFKFSTFGLKYALKNLSFLL